MTAPPAHHRLLADGDDPPVLVKEARGAEGVGRLGAEAAVLRALAHPGVVRLVGLEVEGEVARLALEWVGPHTLATVTGVPVHDAATIIADLADTVADVHRAGLGHGRLTADHVLLGPHGHPVLTGFAEARALRVPDDVRADTAALGALLTAVVGPSEPTGPIPDRRRGGRGDGGRRATLLTLADRAQAGPDDDVLDPAGLAERIRRALGEAPRTRPRIRPVAGRRSTESPPRRRPRRGARRRPAPTSRAVLAAALGATVLATAGAALWLRADDQRAPLSSATTPTTTTPMTSTTADATPPPDPGPARPPTTTAPPCPEPAGPTVADVDGDGCPEDVAVQGERVTIDGVTWVAGRPGDTVVVGDWDCDGIATVASLRPSSGEVFVFPRWSGAGEDLTVGTATTLTGARHLRAVVTGDGCHDLVAVDAAGAPTVVETAA